VRTREPSGGGAADRIIRGIRHPPFLVRDGRVLGGIVDIVDRIWRRATQVAPCQVEEIIIAHVGLSTSEEVSPRAGGV
jgi:hypothetical protein